MTVETATYISDLNSALPAAGDVKSEGDDHMRLIKTVVKATFPNVTGAVTPTHTELNYVDGVTSAIQTQLDSKFGVVSASGGPTTLSAARFQIYVVTTTNADATLPASPTVGDIVIIVYAMNSGSSTVIRNGNNIDNAASNVALGVNSIGILVYGPAGNWTYGSL